MEAWQIIVYFSLFGSITLWIRLACNAIVGKTLRYFGQDIHDPKDIEKAYKVGENFKELSQIYTFWQSIAQSLIDGAFFFIGWNFMKEQPSLFRTCLCVAIIYWVLFSFIMYRHYYVSVTLIFLLLLYTMFCYDLYSLIKRNPSIENANIYLVFSGLQVVNGVVNLAWSLLFLKEYD